MLQLPTGLDAAAQFDLTRLLPVFQPAKHAEVKQDHDGAGEEEGADGGIHHIVIVLQFTLTGVTVRHIVDTKDDG